MNITRESRINSPENLKELAVLRFVWNIMQSYHEALINKRLNNQYRAGKTAALEKFDKENPGMCRPASTAPKERLWLP